MSNMQFNLLLHELQRIGRRTGFLSREKKIGFDANGRHVRARRIGEEIFELGEQKLVDTTAGDRLTGNSLMAIACNHLESDAVEHGYSGQLRQAWDGIGGWVP